MNQTPWPQRLAAFVVSTLLAFSAALAQAAIPAGERQALLDLYASTNGALWSTSTNWNGAAGTECTWYGITCDAGENHVTIINLATNNLTGSLPSDLNNLTGLVVFSAPQNPLTGSIPSLTGMVSLDSFDVRNGQLTGTIPALTGLTSLNTFLVSYNQLSGPIPSLSGLVNLQIFEVRYNQLTGAIPALTGLANLYIFLVNHNQLTGPIPSLAGLTKLYTFLVDNNQLTGPIPSLAGLTSLSIFQVYNNQLSGDVPPVPSPNALLPGLASLCPNALNHTLDAAWDAATGQTPWYAGCTAAAPPIVTAATAIPTLSEIGLGCLAALLFLVGIGGAGIARRPLNGKRANP